MHRLHANNIPLYLIYLSISQSQHLWDLGVDIFEFLHRHQGLAVYMFTRYLLYSLCVYAYLYLIYIVYVFWRYIDSCYIPLGKTDLNVLSILMYMCMYVYIACLHAHTHKQACLSDWLTWLLERFNKYKICRQDNRDHQSENSVLTYVVLLKRNSSVLGRHSFVLKDFLLVERIPCIQCQPIIDVHDTYRLSPEQNLEQDLII